MGGGGRFSRTPGLLMASGTGKVMQLEYWDGAHSSSARSGGYCPRHLSCVGGREGGREGGGAAGTG